MRTRCVVAVVGKALGDVTVIASQLGGKMGGTVATRYDKLARNFLSGVQLACAMILLN